MKIHISGKIVQPVSCCRAHAQPCWISHPDESRYNKPHMKIAKSPINWILRTSPVLPIQNLKAWFEPDLTMEGMIRGILVLAKKQMQKRWKKKGMHFLSHLPRSKPFWPDLPRFSKKSAIFVWTFWLKGRGCCELQNLRMSEGIFLFSSCQWRLHRAVNPLSTHSNCLSWNKHSQNIATVKPLSKELLHAAGACSAFAKLVYN